MRNWYVRPVFFVEDAEKSIRFYQDKLGFILDWKHDEEDRAYVCQVSGHGCEIILQKDSEKAGKGRIYISLDKEQEEAFREIVKRGTNIQDINWGLPIKQILDLDGNELFISFET